jgi:hypothetical protein
VAQYGIHVGKSVMIRANMTSSELLNKISATTPESTLVVFDLDSTIFNVGPRTQAIAHAFINDPENRKKYPEECELLKKINVSNKHWGISDPISELKIKAEIHFFQSIEKFWRQNFFSNDFLKYDELSKGATDFIQNLLNKNISIYYLTGRDSIRMGSGSEASLKQHNLPFDKDHQLHMKPTKGLVDAHYKRDKINDFHKDFKNIWLIDNEPVILIELMKECPFANLVYFNTVHSGRAKAPKELLSLDGSFL